ncbi:hypothetical protein FOCG_18097 [Fusarium oxysporum f. sp. radicis-lycopersici 26381]|nr:hypothetical protein FOCG_18097 [Fusarium oxysporum f. sp. radicis-lycopersici 26381]
MFKAAGLRKIIWYCCECDTLFCPSSNGQLVIGCLVHRGEEEDVLDIPTAFSRGRGTRAAGWLSDYTAEHVDGEMEIMVLLEGIKRWATGSEFVEWMDEYEAGAWTGKQEFA